MWQHMLLLATTIAIASVTYFDVASWVYLLQMTPVCFLSASVWPWMVYRESKYEDLFIWRFWKQVQSVSCLCVYSIKLLYVDYCLLLTLWSSAASLMGMRLCFLCFCVSIVESKSLEKIPYRPGIFGVYSVSTNPEYRTYRAVTTQQDNGIRKYFTAHGAGVIHFRLWCISCHSVVFPSGLILLVSNNLLSLSQIRSYLLSQWSDSALLVPNGFNKYSKIHCYTNKNPNYRIGVLMFV